jgi:sigma-B regulation protein RsbU (phosphoserine phosphatase)
MTQLIIKPPSEPSTTEALSADTVTIGRLPENDIAILDKSVSRSHARLERIAERYRIVDLGSRNGVVVNDQRITEPTFLASGDRILLGDVEIEVQVSRQTPALKLGDTAFEMSPGATMILSREDLPEDLAASLTADEDTIEKEKSVEPGKLLAFFEEVTHAVIEQRASEEVLEEIVRHSLDIMSEADRGCLILREQDELKPRVALNRSGRVTQMELSQTVVRRVAETRDSVLSFNAQEDRRFSATESVVIQGICSVMCVPLVTDGEVLGALYLDTLSPVHRFTPGELKLFTALGNIAAGHIMRQRLLEENIERRVLAEQVKAAAATQRRLLEVEVPDIPGYEFHLDNRPCLHVGGDYVDLLPCEGRIVLVLGDVCGKGIDAAILMATLQAGVHAQASTSTDVKEMATQVNEFLFRRTAPEKFVTLFISCLDPATGRLTYVNAGHDRPAVVRAARGGKREVDRLESTGPMVGAFNEPIFTAQVEETTLEPGDLLVVFTDGLHEAERPDGEDFSEARLVEHFVANAELPAHDLAEATVDTVKAFTAGAEQQDDMTQLIVKRLAG